MSRPLYTLTKTARGGYKAVCNICGFVAIGLSAKTATELIEKHIKEAHR